MKMFLYRCTKIRSGYCLLYYIILYYIILYYIVLYYIILYYIILYYIILYYITLHYIYNNNFLKEQYVSTLTRLYQAAVYALVHVNFFGQNNENLLIHFYTVGSRFTTGLRSRIFGRISNRLKTSTI